MTVEDVKAKLTEWSQHLPKAETVKEKLSAVKDHVIHSRRKRFYAIGALLVITALGLLAIRSSSSRTILAISDADNFYDCGCPTTDGETELHQMTRYWSMQTHNRDRDISVFELAGLTESFGLYSDTSNQSISISKYAFQFSSPKLFLRPDGYTLAKFLITEQYENHMTQGGATFKVIVKGSHTRNSCGYRDYFDGTYTVCCLLREPLNDVQFYLMNVNFVSYQLYYSHHKLIHEVKVDSLNTVDVRTDQVDNGAQWCYKDTGYWVNVADGMDTWRITRNNKLTHFFTKPEIDECFFERYGSHIIFTGDSHLRAAFGYIQYIRGSESIISKEITQKYPVVLAGDMTFYVSTLMESLIENLRMILKNARDKVGVQHEGSDPVRPRLLVIDSGCHDLAYNNSALYISNFKQFFDTLAELKETGLFYIIFQNIPPWPHMMEHDRERHLNTFVNAAVSYWVSKKLEQLDIPIVDIRSYALPFEDMSDCGMHYICHDFPREHKGVAGREATQQILRIACQ